MLEQLVNQARYDHAIYRQAVRENKPLSVILFWANKMRDSEEALKQATKWSRTKLIDVITNAGEY